MRVHGRRRRGHIQNNTFVNLPLLSGRVCGRSSMDARSLTAVLTGMGDAGAREAPIGWLTTSGRFSKWLARSKAASADCTASLPRALAASASAKCFSACARRSLKDLIGGAAKPRSPFVCLGKTEGLAAGSPDTLIMAHSRENVLRTTKERDKLHTFLSGSEGANLAERPQRVSSLVENNGSSSLPLRFALGEAHGGSSTTSFLQCDKVAFRPPWAHFTGNMTDRFGEIWQLQSVRAEGDFALASVVERHAGG